MESFEDADLMLASAIHAQLSAIDEYVNAFVLILNKPSDEQIGDITFPRETVAGLITLLNMDKFLLKTFYEENQRIHDLIEKYLKMKEEKQRKSKEA